MRRIFFGLIVLICFPTLAFAQTNLPVPTGFVSDLAQVLSTETEVQLQQTLSVLQRTNGAEIAVLTVSSLQGRPLEDFSLEVARTWGIGTAERDNGLLILIAPTERETRIEVGYGLEGFMTDAQSSWIIRNVMIPSFRTGDFDAGVLAGVDRIVKAITEGDLIPSPSSSADISPGDLASIIFSNAIFFLFFLFPWFAAIFGKSKRWWPGGVVGGGLGVVAWTAWSVTAWAILGLAVFGFALDYFVSKNYKEGKSSWWAGGRFGGGGRGGFGGFSGGGFGGGGSSGSW